MTKYQLPDLGKRVPPALRRKLLKAGKEALAGLALAAAAAVTEHLLSDPKEPARSGKERPAQKRLPERRAEPEESTPWDRAKKS